MKEILRNLDKALTIDPGRRLDKGECKWFNKIKYVKILHVCNRERVIAMTTWV